MPRRLALFSLWAKRYWNEEKQSETGSGANWRTNRPTQFPNSKTGSGPNWRTNRPIQFPYISPIQFPYLNSTGWVCSETIPVHELNKSVVRKYRRNQFPYSRWLYRPVIVSESTVHPLHNCPNVDLVNGWPFKNRKLMFYMKIIFLFLKCLIFCENHWLCAAVSCF